MTKQTSQKTAVMVTATIAFFQIAPASAEIE